MFTSLTTGDSVETSSEVGISSLVDSWLLVRYLENNGERNRGLYILKSRGMNHSNQIREFRVTDHGVELLDVYLGKDGILTGTSRVTHEAEAKIEAENRVMEIESKKRELERKQKEFAAQITSLQDSIGTLQDELDRIAYIEQLRKQMAHGVESEIAQSRWADDTDKNETNQAPMKEDL